MGQINASEAIRMLDTFESVGVTHFDITHLNLAGEKRGFRPGQGREQARRSIPFLVESAFRRQNNVIVRPSGSACHLVQLDDLSQTHLARVRPAVFLVLETSPGNFQGWLAVEGGSAELSRRIRKAAGADASASGATRVAGTLNFKPKYAPDFPTVEIVEANRGRTVTKEQLVQLGLVAQADESKPLRASWSRSGHRRAWPDYGRCIEGAPPNHDGSAPDVSRADFAWCMTAIDWGWGIEDVAARLMQESTKAQENGERYALLTAQNAAAAVESRLRNR